MSGARAFDSAPEEEDFYLVVFFCFGIIFYGRTRAQRNVMMRSVRSYVCCGVVTKIIHSRCIHTHTAYNLKYHIIGGRSVT